MSPSVTMQVAQAFPQPVSFFGPRVEARWATSTEWDVFVAAPLGNPTSARLRITVEVWIPNTSANMNEDTSGTWVSVNALTNPSMLPDGDWPDPVATSGAIPSLFVSRRVATPLMHRLAFDLTFEGGTSPAFPLTIRYTSK